MDRHGRKMPLTKLGGRVRAKNPHAVALSRLGASKGGKARASKLSPKRRTEIARKAARARWNKQGRKPER